ncbi:MAG: alpha/beta hydrolase, partial [Dehalococcoidales bacterium]
MPFVKVNDINIYYEIHGSGPRLLVISGTGGDLRNKPNTFDWPLASHFEILGYDQRGLGQTDKPDIPCTIADYARDAAGLLEALGWDSCSVMGVSFGGMVAQEMALGYPGRVKQLVLACTSSGGGGGASYPIHEFDLLPPRERALRVIPVRDTRNDEAWQTAQPQEFQQMVEQTAARFQKGADEPATKAGA